MLGSNSRVRAQRELMRATGFSYWAGIARDTLCLANEAGGPLIALIKRGSAVLGRASRCREIERPSRHHCHTYAAANARAHVRVGPY